MTRPRYFVAIGTQEDAHRCKALKHMLLVFDRCGVTIHVDKAMPFVRLPDERGVVLGTLYPKEGGPLKPDDIIRDAALPATHLARILAEQFWGSYVALVVDASDVPLVARDPSGALSAYYREVEGKLLISNEVRLLAQHFSILWSRVRADIATEGFHSAETCLAGIQDLRPGMHLRLRNGLLEEQGFWSPWDHVGPLAPSRRTDLAARLRQTIFQVVAALADGYRRPLMFMSGGLDSSIVLAGLKDRGIEADCLTTYTQDRAGDERGHARYLAAALEMPLSEHMLDPAQVDLTLCAAPHLPRPRRRPLFQEMARAARIASGGQGNDIIVTGSGGDQIFCSTQSANAIVDALKARMPLLEILATFENICTLTDCSLGEAIAAVGRRLRRPVRYDWPLRMDLLAQDAEVERPQHPWLDCPDGVGPGKAYHVAMVLRVQESIESVFDADGPPVLNPLISQPLMEFCLSVPTWEWVRGGRNRSLARDAFDGDLPQAILNRRAKPGPMSFSTQLLMGNVGRLKDLLLGGLLAEQQILDVCATSKALDDLMIQGSSIGLRILQLADVETWCRHWSSAPLD